MKATGTRLDYSLGVGYESERPHLDCRVLELAMEAKGLIQISCRVYERERGHVQITESWSRLRKRKASFRLQSLGIGYESERAALNCIDLESAMKAKGARLVCRIMESAMKAKGLNQTVVLESAMEAKTAKFRLYLSQSRKQTLLDYRALESAVMKVAARATVGLLSWNRL